MTFLGQPKGRKDDTAQSWGSNPILNHLPIEFKYFSWIILHLVLFKFNRMDFLLVNSSTNFCCLDFGIPLLRTYATSFLRLSPCSSGDPSVHRGGTALPHGLPHGIQKEFPLSVRDQQETEAWQLLSHQRLEAELQVEVDGYVSF